MGEDKSILMPGVEPMNLAQRVDMLATAIEAKEMLWDADRFLDGIGVKLLTATIAVHVKDMEHPKVVTISWSALSNDQLKDLIENVARNSDNYVRQASLINEIAQKLGRDDDQKLHHTAEDCKACPARETCPERIQ